MLILTFLMENIAECKLVCRVELLILEWKGHIRRQTISFFFLFFTVNNSFCCQFVFDIMLWNVGGPWLKRVVEDFIRIRFSLSFSYLPRLWLPLFYFVNSVFVLFLSILISDKESGKSQATVRSWICTFENQNHLTNNQPSQSNFISIYFESFLFWILHWNIW